MQALRTAATGMSAQQMNVEVISNNIANMNTIGFKRQRAEAQSSDQGTVVPTGVQVGGGVKTGSVYRIVSQGAATRTENPLDIAIQGRGYLQVLMPSGETAYTRAGNLSLNDQGQLVTDDGYLIQPAITVPEDAVDITISKTGQVQISKADAAVPEIAGQLELASFVNEAGLEAMGDNLFMESGSSGPAVTGVPGAVGFGQLMQGYTEASNVDAVSEVTALIVAQRAYEMNSKVITTADEMLRAANQVKS